MNIVYKKRYSGYSRFEFLFRFWYRFSVLTDKSITERFFFAPESTLDLGDFFSFSAFASNFWERFRFVHIYAHAQVSIIGGEMSFVRVEVLCSRCSMSRAGLYISRFEREGGDDCLSSPSWVLASIFVDMSKAHRRSAITKYAIAQVAFATYATPL